MTGVKCIRRLIQLMLKIWTTLSCLGVMFGGHVWGSAEKSLLKTVYQNTRDLITKSALYMEHSVLFFFKYLHIVKLKDLHELGILKQMYLSLSYKHSYYSHWSE